MIEAIEGKGVGAGKSYYVCTRILTYLASGGTVFASTNFGLNWDESKALVEKRWGLVLEEDQYVEFPADQTYRLHEMTPPGTPEKPVLVIVDEAHAQLNARDYADKEKRPFFNWLTQSRHDDTDVIFITQHTANMDRQIMRLVTYITRVRNMANFSIPGLCKWPFKQFVANIYDQDGKTLQERKWMWHDKAIFKCYRSKVMRGAHKRLAMTVPKKKLNKSKKIRPKMKIWILLAICGLAYGVYRFTQLRNTPGSYLADKAPKAEVKEKAPAPVPLPAVVTDQGRPKGAYDISAEELRATDNRTYLRTVSGEYWLNRFCSRGYVDRVSNNVARVRQPDGRILFVVAEWKAQPPVLPIDPPRDPIPAQKAEPYPALKSIADAEQARVRAELERPIGSGNASGLQRR